MRQAGTVRSLTRNLVLMAVSIFCFNLGASNAQAATNRLGWSSQQAATWEQMRASNHSLWQRLKSEADRSDLYNDQGLRKGMTYLICQGKSCASDQNYAQAAWNTIKYYRGRTYNTAGSTPDRNTTRDRFGSLSMLYSWVADGLSSTDKANFRDVLDYWSDLVLLTTAHGTRASDSDEATGHYFGLVLYALAIQSEDSARSSQILNFPGGAAAPAVGGVDSTGVNMNTLRNTMAFFSKKSKGGVWIESSQYNVNSVRYFLQGIDAINKFYGVDKFPEATAMYTDYAKAFVQELTPDFKDSFQWGDVQDNHKLSLYDRLGTVSTVAALSNDPKMWHVVDRHDDEYTSIQEEHYYNYVNPYASRQAPSGVSSHNGEGRGLAYFHSGWNVNDSFFGSWHQTHTGVDHESATQTNFGLFRNGKWAINHPIGYLIADDANYNNTIKVSGGIDYASEARGQAAFEAGNNYMYHVGVTGGQLVYENYWDYPPELLHEWTRSYLYLHNDNGSDTVLVFDRLNNSDPLSDITTAKFNRIPSTERTNITNAAGKHQWIIHMPVSPSVSGNTATWTADSGELVTLKSFFSSAYTTATYYEPDYHNKGLNPNMVGTINSSELKYQLRLIPTQKNGFQSMMDVVHVGSSFNSTEILASAGEAAKGIKLEVGNQNIVAMFNGGLGNALYTVTGVPAALQATGSNANGNSGFDPNRLTNLSKLRFLQSGFNFSFNSALPTTLYLADLDPTHQWFADINGNSVQLTVSNAGLAKVNIATVGLHTISVHEEGVIVSPSGNQFPSAVVSGVVVSGKSVSFSGSQSFDPDGNALTYSWNFGNGQTSTQVSPSHTYAVDGNYSVTLTVNDGQASASASTSVLIQTTTTPPVSTNEDHWREAEAGTLTSPMVSASDAGASGSSYVSTATSNSGYATFNVTITTAGNYYFWGRIKAATDSNNSLFVKVDNGIEAIWDTAFTNAWGWEKMNKRIAVSGDGQPIVMNLSAGNHTIQIRGREVMAMIDKIYVTNNSSAVPTGLGGTGDTNEPPPAVNNSPTINAIADVSINEGSAMSQINISASDIDGDALTMSASVNGSTLAAQGMVFSSSGGAGTFNWTPADGKGGQSFTITMTVQDGNGGTATKLFTITVLDINHNPSAVNDSFNVNQNSSANMLDVMVNDSIAPDTGETLSISSVAAPLHGLAAVASGKIQYTSTAGYSGSDSFQYTISDGKGGTAVGSVAMTIAPLVVTAIGYYEAEAVLLTSPMVSASDAGASGSSYVSTATSNSGYATFNVTITTAGNYYFWGRIKAATDSNNSLFVKVDNGIEAIWDTAFTNAWGWEKMNKRIAVSGDGQPIVMNLSAGNHTIQIRGREASAKLDKIFITNSSADVPTGLGDTVVVVPPSPPVNNPPTMNAIADVSVNEGSAMNQINVSASDIDGDALTLSASVSGSTLAAQGMSFSAGAFNWTPANGKGGQSFAITMTAQDGNGGTATKSFTIAVLDVVPVSPTIETHYYEAELGYDFISPMQTGSDAGASNGGYIYSSIANSGEVTINVNIQQEGDYVLWGRVKTPTNVRNSFFLIIDNGTQITWDTPVNGSWNWSHVTDNNASINVVVHLTAGNHTIKVKGKEYKAWLDKLMLTSDATLVPTGM